MSTDQVTPGSVGSTMNGRRRSTILSQIQVEQLEELDDIKIKTMYRMVEDIEVSDGGLSVAKKFLYLSNKQAASFNSGNMHSVLQALEIPQCHFVMRLMPGFHGMDQHTAHTERAGTVGQKLTFPPEICKDDINRTEAQMLLFVKQCILPVAMQTRALLLVGGCNDDTMAMAVQRVMGPIQKRMGKSCPFTIIGMCSSYEVHAKAHAGSRSIAGQFASQSKSWSRKFNDIHGLITGGTGGDDAIASMQQCDINSSCTHFICFEAIDWQNGKIDDKPRFAFENTFVECTVSHLPSIVIQSHNAEHATTELADIIRRKIPLLVLDARERWPLLTPDENPSQCANPCTLLAQSTGACKPPELKEGEKLDVVAVATERLTKHLTTLVEQGNGGKGTRESWDTSTLAFCIGLANYTEETKKRSPQRLLSLHNAIKSEEAASDSSSGFSIVNSGESEQETIEKALTDLFFELAGAFNNQGNIRICESYMESRNPSFEVDGGDDGDDSAQNSLFQNDPKVKAAQNYLRYYQKKQVDIDANNGRDNTRSVAKWLAVYEMIKSDNCFAESIYDLKGISEIMSNVAKIDHLPEKNTLEALILIRRAWSTVDAYHNAANFFKNVAKICYLLMLILGIATVVAVSLEVTGDIQYFMYNGVNSLTLGLGLATTIIVGFTSYMNPATRWHVLRSSALNLESEIWGFRTRTGKYSEDRLSVARGSEMTFQESLKDVMQETLQSGDLRRTPFYSKPPSNWAGHGQYENRGCCACCFNRNSKNTIVPSLMIDNHHSPLKPAEFISFRLLPALKFYQSRLPSYARSRSFATTFMIFGSLSTCVMSFIGLSTWVSVVSAITSAIVAWTEFAGTEKKLDRYSNTVSSLELIQMWWDALPEVERLASKSIDFLVESVENQIRNEHQGWRATSPSMQKLQEAMGKVMEENKRKVVIHVRQGSNPR